MNIDMKTGPVEFARALADPTRQKIMDICCCAWLNVGEIVDRAGVSQPTVSHHLAILREAGLVDVRQEGKHSYYTLNQQKVVMCCGMIMQVFAPDEIDSANRRISDSTIADRESSGRAGESTQP